MKNIAKTWMEAKAIIKLFEACGPNSFLKWFQLTLPREWMERGLVWVSSWSSTVWTKRTRKATNLTELHIAFPVILQLDWSLPKLTRINKMTSEKQYFRVKKRQ